MLSLITADHETISEEAKGGDAITNGKDQRKKYEVSMLLKRIATLEAFLENGNRTEFMKVYHEIMNALSGNPALSGLLFAETYYTFVNLFLSLINRWNLEETLSKHVDLKKLTKMEVHSSWTEITHFFGKVAEGIFKCKGGDESESIHFVIHRIRKYIKEHLSDDVSLTRLAEVIHINSSYLCRLYKQETGISLSEYIAELKIDLAKTLLEQCDMKIYDISIALGFESPSSLNRFFKKHMNMTPQEYRGVALKKRE